MTLHSSKSQNLSANQISSIISINGWDIATSGFGKQTSAILEFFSRLWFRPYRSNRHIIMHQNTKFDPNRSTGGRYMTSCWFLKMAAAAAKYYFRFPNCWCHFFRKSNSVIKPVSSTYLNSRLRCNFFCFGKRNVRHIGILFPVSISIILP